MSTAPTFALIAGEASGDQLGGKLIAALHERFPGARCFGVGGRHMRDAGFDAWYDREVLSVMGLFEVTRHLPRLLRLRRELERRIIQARPDVFVGIDAPDFNLGLERKLKAAGVRTVQYVSPTIWAWRASRAAGVAAAADLVLCIFPFEPELYRDLGIVARYTGHPMADVIDNDPDRGAARRALDLDPGPEPPLIALLPGSRHSEVERLAGPLLDAADRLARRAGGARFVAALADEATAATFRDAVAGHDDLDCTIVVGRSLEALAAADAVVCASGTASLECVLVNRPPVVVYRMAGASHWLIDRLGLVKTPYIALPNILAGEALVPELVQEQASGPRIAEAVEGWLGDPARRAALRIRFAELHGTLRQDAAASAAEAIGELLARRRA